MTLLMLVVFYMNYLFFKLDALYLFGVWPTRLHPHHKYTHTTIHIHTSSRSTAPPNILSWLVPWCPRLL